MPKSSYNSRNIVFGSSGIMALLKRTASFMNSDRTSLSAGHGTSKHRLKLPLSLPCLPLQKVHPFVRLSVIFLLSFYLGSLNQTIFHDGSQCESSEWITQHLSQTVTTGRLIEEEGLQNGGTPFTRRRYKNTSFPYTILSLEGGQIYQNLGIQALTGEATKSIGQNSFLLIPKTEKAKGDGEAEVNSMDDCAVVKILLTDQSYYPSKQPPNGPQPHEENCLDLMAQPTFGTNQVFQWNRSSRAKGEAKNATHLDEINIYAETQHFFSSFSSFAKTLHAVVGSAPPKHQDRATIALLVITNFEELTIFQNVVCAAKRVKLDLSSFLAVCFDEYCYNYVKDKLEIKSFYQPNLISPNQLGQPEDRLVASQIYLSYLILHAGFNLASIDLYHVVPGASNLFDQIGKNDPDDIFFTAVNCSSTKPSTQLAAPWLINTDIFYVKSNIRTKYLYSQLIVQMYQFTGCHDGESTFDLLAKTLSEVVWEQVSLFGLRPKVLSFSLLSDSLVSFGDTKKDISHETQDTVESLKAAGRWFLKGGNGECGMP
mmetsp:Transcript_8205/g.10716  ORF Transcript_8205/g.10716 Transcript_8205/m.10716 type:complete len:541 (+) Transcript_8205:32-1654(+)